MEMNKLNEELSKIKVSDSLRARILLDMQKYQMDQKQSVQTATPKSRNLRIQIVTATLALIVIISGIITLIRPFDSELTGCLPGLEDRYFSLNEMTEKAYVLKGNGIFISYQPPNTLMKVAQLPVNQLYCDGRAFYYAKGHKIYEFSIGQNELTKRSIIWRADQAISIDYINANIIITHSGNNDDYSLISRSTGRINKLIERSDAKYFSLVTASEQVGIFQYSDFERAENNPDKKPDGLFSINWLTMQIDQIYEGKIIGRVEIVGKNVFFTPSRSFSDGMVSGEYSPELWKVNIDGHGLKQVDLSAMSLVGIQSIARSGMSLLIATDDIIYGDEMQGRYHHGKIYRFDIQTNQSYILQNNIGLIDRLFASPNFYCYYNTSSSGTQGEVIIRQIDTYNK